jgi:hypothetical protein
MRQIRSDLARWQVDLGAMLPLRYDMLCCADEAKMTGDKQADERVNTSVNSPLEALDRYEEFMAELARNPRFVRAEPSGVGFIIPQPKGAKAGDAKE